MLYYVCNVLHSNDPFFKQKSIFLRILSFVGKKGVSNGNITVLMGVGSSPKLNVTPACIRQRSPYPSNWIRVF